jgi:hypothetical protein
VRTGSVASAARFEQDLTDVGKNPWLSHMTELMTCVFDLGKQGVFRRHVRAVTLKAVSLFFDVDRHVSDLLQNVCQNPATVAHALRMLQVCILCVARWPIFTAIFNTNCLEKNMHAGRSARLIHVDISRLS